MVSCVLIYLSRLKNLTHMCCKVQYPLMISRCHRYDLIRYSSICVFLLCIYYALSVILHSPGHIIDRIMKIPLLEGYDVRH